MLSAVGLLITFFLGLVGWRIQLIGKRRTELAEEALLAFAQAVDALANMRTPIRWSNELEALRKDKGHDPTRPMHGEDGLVVFRRFKEAQDRFSALRRLELLCRYHFGDAAARAFDELRKAVREVTLAAHLLATTGADELTSPAGRETRLKWERTIYAAAANPDPIEERVQAAQRDLETVLTPHLRADAAFLPIAVGWRTYKARAAALIRRRTPLGPEKAPD